MKNQKDALLPLYWLSAGEGRRLKIEHFYNFRFPSLEHVSLNSLIVPSMIS